jgi:hypothetical protein
MTKFKTLCLLKHPWCTGTNNNQKAILPFTVAIVFFIIIIVVLLPVNVQVESIPAIVNGITTSTSIVIGFGGTTIGLAFRGEKDIDSPKAKKMYYYLISLLILPLVYPLGSYTSLAQNQAQLALKLSLGGFLVAFWAIITVYVLIGKRWDINEEKRKTVSNDGKLTAMPSHDEIRYAILTVLYKRAEKSPDYSSIDRTKLMEILNIKQETLDFNVLYLAEEKLVKLTTVLNVSFKSARITSAGINIFEHKDENKTRFPFLNATMPIQIETKIGLVNL